MFEMIQGADASVLLWIQEHLRFAFSEWANDIGRVARGQRPLLDHARPCADTDSKNEEIRRSGIDLSTGLLSVQQPAAQKPCGTSAALYPDTGACHADEGAARPLIPLWPRLCILRHSRSIDVEHGQEMESGADPRIGGGSLDRIQPPLCGCPLPHRCLGWCVGRARWQLDHLPYL